MVYFNITMRTYLYIYTTTDLIYGAQFIYRLRVYTRTRNGKPIYIYDSIRHSRNDLPSPESCRFFVSRIIIIIFFSIFRLYIKKKKTKQNKTKKNPPSPVFPRDNNKLQFSRRCRRVRKKQRAIYVSANLLRGSRV